MKSNPSFQRDSLPASVLFVSSIRQCRYRGQNGLDKEP